MHRPLSPEDLERIEQLPWGVVGIGAPKCATTWLAKTLATHPGFFQTGERDFFSPGARLTDYYQAFFKDIIKDFLVDPQRTPSTYNNLYLYDTYALDYIKDHYPQAKIYVSLRDPVTRTISHHLHNMVWSGLYGPETSLEEAIQMHASSGLMEMSFYERYLPPWIEAFGRENLFVFIMEDLRQDAQECLNRFLGFLRVQEHEMGPEQKKAVNQNIIEQIKAKPESLERLREAFAPTRGYVEELTGRDLSSMWSGELKRISLGHQTSRDQVMLARALQHYENGRPNYRAALTILVDLYNQRFAHPLVYSLTASILDDADHGELAGQVREIGRLVCSGVVTRKQDLPPVVLEF